MSEKTYNITGIYVMDPGNKIIFHKSIKNFEDIPAAITEAGAKLQKYFEKNINCVLHIALTYDC